MMCVNGFLSAQPDWGQIRANARFLVGDTAAYEMPAPLSLAGGGWEDGLYVTRDGRHLFCTYVPGDLLAWLQGWYLCKPFSPYLRGPLLDIDTLTNPFGCPSYIHSDIVKADWDTVTHTFPFWRPSVLRKPVTYEGAACGVLKNKDTFDVFVFTLDTGAMGMEIMLLREVPTDPSCVGAVPILSSPAHEDNPHIERLSDGRLLLFFDRDREIYYSLSADEGMTWSAPVRVSRVLNDYAPYDVQPHLWYDGLRWWVYFSAPDERGFRSIYRSRQLIPDDWDSWGPRELVIAPLGVEGGYANFIAVGEPSLTQEGDLYFVVGYGNTLQPDTTDMFDIDPWVMRRKRAPASLSAQGRAPDLQYDKGSETLCLSDAPPGGQLRLYEGMGRFLYALPINSEGKAILSTAGLSAGLYFLQVEGGKGIQTLRWFKAP